MFEKILLSNLIVFSHVFKLSLFCRVMLQPDRVDKNSSSLNPLIGLQMFLYYGFLVLPIRAPDISKLCVGGIIVLILG